MSRAPLPSGGAAAEGEATSSKDRGIAVSVTLFASLRRRRPDLPDGPQRVALAAGATLADLLVALGLARDLDVAAAINGDLATLDTPLPDGADVILMTPMEGGAAAEGEATSSKDGPAMSRARRPSGGAAAEGEATSSKDGPAMSRPRRPSGGAAAEGAATNLMEGGRA
jgi:sulfur carrier protein ThiS